MNKINVIGEVGRLDSHTSMNHKCRVFTPKRTIYIDRVEFCLSNPNAVSLFVENESVIAQTTEPHYFFTMNEPYKVGEHQSLGVLSSSSTGFYVYFDYHFYVGEDKPSHVCRSEDIVEMGFTHSKMVCKVCNKERI